MKQLFFLFVIVAYPLFSQNILSHRERAELIEKIQKERIQNHNMTSIMNRRFDHH